MNCDDNFALYAVSIDAADAATCKQPSNQSADWPAGRLFGPLEHVVERWHKRTAIGRDISCFYVSHDFQ